MHVYEQEVMVSIEVSATVKGRPAGPEYMDDGYEEIEVEEWSKDAVVSIDGEECAVSELPAKLQKQLWDKMVASARNEYWD